MVTMKKLLTAILVMTLLISLAPALKADAATKLNKSKITIKTDNTYNLSLSGVSKGIKWTTSDKTIAKVSSAGKVKGLDAGEATITAAYANKKYTCKVTVEYDIDTMLIDTYNWVIGIWNDGFCNIYHYLEDGLDATGQNMDINETIEKTDKYMEEFEKYDKFVKSLSEDDYYEDLNELWPKLSDEIQYLYSRIKDEIPRAGDTAYEFNYKKFNDYMYELMDAIY